MAAREALGGPPETIVLSPFQNGEVPRAVWVRRMAHEAAIHRLDAESALDLSTTFSPEFAVDGIDEYLGFLTPNRRPAPEDGTVLFRATDTGDAWTVRLTAGELPRTERAADTADVTLSGPADQLYRAVCGRPAETSTAGEARLLRPLVTF